MLYTSVQGGTGAGRKKALAFPFPHDWKCLKCGNYNKKNWANCSACVAPRPNFQ
jgi:hypothetical protein